MKILYIITLAEYGGAQAHLMTLIPRLAGQAQIALICGDEGPLTEMVRSYGVQVELVPTLGRAISPLNDVETTRHLAAYMKRSQPALVHVHSSKAGLLGRLAARVTGIPVVYTAHGWGFKPGVPTSRRWIVWGSELAAGRLCDHIICVSKYDYELARRYQIAPATSLSTIYNGLADTTLRADPTQEPVRIVMTARFQEPKDQATLMRAFAGLDVSSHPAELLLIGSGPFLPACRSLAQELDIAERVRFLGDRNDVAQLLAQSQVFVLLSRYEGLPISILEAMRAGLPVVATGVGGIPELVEHGVSGFLVQDGQVEAVRNHLHTLIRDAAQRKAMGDQGRKRYTHTFAADIMVEKTVETYRQVLARRENAVRTSS